MRWAETVRRLFGRAERSGPRAIAEPKAVGPADVEFLPGDYWHFTSASPVNFLFNNVWSGQGWLRSMSSVRREHGDRFITLGDLYPLTGEATEELWERVRAERFAQKPSRRGALFLFDRRDLAEDCAAQWMPSTENVVLKAWIPRQAKVHVGHIAWLAPAGPPQEESATRYWAGEACPDRPDLREYVVDGNIYFPDWRLAPFAPFGAGAKPPALPSEIVACPACGIEFNVSPPNAATFWSADRPRCIDDPDLPMLVDCPHVATLIEAAWERLGPARRIAVRVRASGGASDERVNAGSTL